MSGPQAHHAVLQSLYDDKDLQKLFDLIGGRKWVDGPFNIINLPNDALVAEQANVVRHASRHPWVAIAQKEVLDQFYRSFFNGKRVGDILDNPTAYAADLPVLRRSTETLLNDLRDTSIKALIERRLPLTRNDALFPNITPEQATARATEIFSPAKFKLSADGMTTASTAELAALRTARQNLIATGGDVAWLAFDTPEKMAAYVDAVAANAANKARLVSNGSAVPFFKTLNAMDPTGEAINRTADRGAAAAAYATQPASPAARCGRSRDGEHDRDRGGSADGGQRRRARANPQRGHLRAGH